MNDKIVAPAFRQSASCLSEPGALALLAGCYDLSAEELLHAAIRIESERLGARMPERTARRLVTERFGRDRVAVVTAALSGSDDESNEFLDEAIVYVRQALKAGQRRKR